ncbi:MAG: hypothetical protein QOG38_796 [Hyphomicrobiales bacterium]|nr:hypothetical protein [Hyphomicrobiales bacterium]
MGAGGIGPRKALAIRDARAAGAAITGNREKNDATGDDAASSSTLDAPHTHVQRPCPAVTGARGLEADDQRA